MQLAMYRILQLPQMGFILLIMFLSLTHVLMFFFGRWSKLHHIRKHHLPQICGYETARLEKENVDLKEKLTEALRRIKLYMEILSVIRHVSKKEENIVGGGK